MQDRETDFEAVKEIALMMLHLPIRGTDFLPAVQHPFTSTSLVSAIGQDGSYQIEDIAADKGAHRRLRYGHCRL